MQIDTFGETPISHLFHEPNCQMNGNFKASLQVMIKELSRLFYKKIRISKTNMDFIQKNPNVQELFEMCTFELKVMDNSKFYNSYSFFSVLKMSDDIKKLACLTKNEEFVIHFKASFHKFSNFKSDLETIFKEAILIRDESESIIMRLYFTLIGDILPDLVLRKLVEYLTLEDLPLPV